MPDPQIPPEFDPDRVAEEAKDEPDSLPNVNPDGSINATPSADIDEPPLTSEAFALVDKLFDSLLVEMRGFIYAKPADITHSRLVKSEQLLSNALSFIRKAKQLMSR